MPPVFGRLVPFLLQQSASELTSTTVISPHSSFSLYLIPYWTLSLEELTAQFVLR